MKRLLLGLVLLLLVVGPASAQQVTKGGQYLSTLPTLASQEFASPLLDVNQRLVTKPFGSFANDWKYVAAASGIVNTTTAVTIKAAAGAGLRNCITALDVSSDGALATATEFAIRDGAAGTVVWRIKIGTGGLQAGRSVAFVTPICGTANTLLEALTLTQSATGAVYLNVQGFTTP